MRLLICGGRDVSDAEKVWAEIDRFIRDDQAGDTDQLLVITGGASGVDQWAEQWALRKGLPCMVFHPAWQTFHKAAGPIRNGWMLEHGKPDQVLALWGGKGTRDMIAKARAAGVPVEEIKAQEVRG
jgi:hypothetical protein